MDSQTADVVWIEVLDGSEERLCRRRHDVRDLSHFRPRQRKRKKCSIVGRGSRSNLKNSERQFRSFAYENENKCHLNKSVLRNLKSEVLNTQRLEIYSIQKVFSSSFLFAKILCDISLSYLKKLPYKFSQF